MYEYFAYIYVYAPWVHCDLGDKKKILDPIFHSQQAVNAHHTYTHMHTYRQITHTCKILYTHLGHFNLFTIINNTKKNLPAYLPVTFGNVYFSEVRSHVLWDFKEPEKVQIRVILAAPGQTPGFSRSLFFYSPHPPWIATVGPNM